MGKVTVVALSMADSYWPGLTERILGNTTKTVSRAVFDLDDSMFDHGRYDLKGGDRGRRQPADKIWGVRTVSRTDLS